MPTATRIFLWLALALASFLPASALTPTAPENCIWEIFSIGYDAATTQVTDACNRTETPTSDYDSAPIHRATTEGMPTEVNRALFGQSPEFKAAEGAEGATGLADEIGILRSASQGKGNFGLGSANASDAMRLGR